MRLIAVLSMAALLACLPAMAQPTEHLSGEDIDAISEMHQTLRAVHTTDQVRYSTTDEGYVSHLGAPAGAHYENDAAKSGSPVAAARGFTLRHKKAIGAGSDKTDFVADRYSSEDSRHYVRLDQTYDGIPVFGAQTVVQLDDDNQVRYFKSDVMRRTKALDADLIDSQAALSGADALAEAVAFMDTVADAAPYEVEEGPELTWYDPKVVGNNGPVQLTYRFIVRSSNAADVRRHVFIDAHTGAVALEYNLIHDAKNRVVFDANNTSGTGSLARSEGDGPTGNVDVDDAYDYLGDTYDFYFDQHGRDSIDGGGMTMRATVRWGPMQNAFWDGSAMFFGEGFATDDITSHELTHGVTQNESNLVYMNESGAINESFSDVWGEFVDLTNTGGNDGAAVRWLMGEDVPGFGAIRNMANPPAFNDPDRYNSPLFLRNTSFDNGGVHINSGVSNKLCYLLTDGDTFNGFNIQGMGIARVAELYYEMQTNLLTSSSNYFDMFDALLQAATNRGFTPDEFSNVLRAGLAVEIGEAGRPTHFRAISSTGTNNIQLNWRNQLDTGDVPVVRRSTSDYPSSETGGTPVTGLSGDEHTDTAGAHGQLAGSLLFYSLFDQSLAPEDETKLAQNQKISVVEVGAPTVDFLTEAFDFGDFADISFTQITYSPTGDPSIAPIAGQYGFYNVEVKKGVFGLPVDDTDAIPIPMIDNGLLTIPPTPTTVVGENVFPAAIPFMGESVRQLALSAKGFLGSTAIFTADAKYKNAPLFIPSLVSHFEVPRISFLFADLSPSTGGSIWYKNMEDRAVVTFEKVPQLAGSQGFPNTVQVEIFYSGHIRVTYQEVNVVGAVVGLSDGNGVPKQLGFETNFSELNGASSLSIDPIPVQRTVSLSPVEFTPNATGLTKGTPQLWTIYEDTLPTNASIDNQTGAFSWTPGLTHTQEYSVTIQVESGGQTAAQTFFIDVSILDQVPTASNLEVLPSDPVAGQPLTGSYVYSHPSFVPELLSTYHWFRNGGLVPVLSNTLVVPAEAVKAGDTWAFGVTPISVIGQVGNFVQSDPVLVLDQMKGDVNNDKDVNIVDLQLVVNGVLGVKSEGPTDVDGNGSVDIRDINEVVGIILSDNE
jgi:Zn-dependent metalloprotease